MEFLILDKNTKATTLRSMTEQGYMLIRDCVLTRSGVFEYLASEFQPKAYNDRKPDDIIYVYRSADTVAASAAGFSGAPLTNDHPPVMLDALNTNKYQTGHVNGGVRVEDNPDEPGEKLMVADLLVSDASQIAALQTGKDELSNGYYSRYDFTPGVAPDGRKYDCEQHTIRPNHVAVVDAGRSGPMCKVSDAKPDLPNPEEELSMSTVTINGVTYECSDQVAQAVSQLQAELNELQSKLPTPEEAAAAQSQVEELQAQLESAQTAVTPEAMDAAVEERSEVVNDAKALIPNFDHKGKSNAAIRLEVVKAKCPEIANLDKKPVDYVTARFEALRSAPADKPKQSALSGHLSHAVTDKRSGRDPELENTDAARQKAVERKRGAWKK